MIDELIACQPDPKWAARAHFAAAAVEGGLTLAFAFMCSAASGANKEPVEAPIRNGVAVMLAASTFKFGSSTFKHIVKGKDAARSARTKASPEIRTSG